MSRRQPLEETVTIPTLAKMTGKHRRTLHRQLLGMHARDLVRNPQMVPWLFRYGGDRGRWRVNRSRMLECHPEWFKGATVESLKTDIDDLREDTEREHRRINQRVDAIAQALRKHREHEGRSAP